MTPTQQRHPLAHALPLFLLAGVCLTALDTTAKYLVRDHSLFLVVWARYVGQMLVVTPFARHRGGPRFWRTRNLRMQLVRSACLVVATMLFFRRLALPAAGRGVRDHVPGARHHRGPVATGTGRASDARALGSGDHRLRRNPGTAAARIVDPASGRGAADRRRGLQRVLSDADPQAAGRQCVHDAVLQRAGGRGRLHAGAAVGVRQAPRSPGANCGFLALLGLLAGVAHWLLISAFLLAPASLLTPFSYLQMLWATLFGYVVFGQLPDRWSALGMAIILGSGVLLALLERRRARLARSFP